jgi:molybdopterin-guanine dinucleotide biosynthesis protein A
MGTDKSTLVYNDHLPQRQYLYNLLKPRCEAVFLSCRADQLDALSDFDTLPDKYTNMGPMSALLTAFEHDPTSAWLVVACDMPFVDGNCIDFLLENRNPAKAATVFQNPESQNPEPLIGIWECNILKTIQRNSTNQNHSPTKLLKQNDIQLLSPVNPKWLLNVNTQRELIDNCQPI